jgi:hypothetical protein
MHDDACHNRGQRRRWGEQRAARANHNQSQRWAGYCFQNQRCDLALALALITLALCVFHSHQLLMMRMSMSFGLTPVEAKSASSTLEKM